MCWKKKKNKKFVCYTEEEIEENKSYEVKELNAKEFESEIERIFLQEHKRSPITLKKLQTSKGMKFYGIIDSKKKLLSMIFISKKGFIYNIQTDTNYKKLGYASKMICFSKSKHKKLSLTCNYLKNIGTKNMPKRLGEFYKEKKFKFIIPFFYAKWNCDKQKKE